MSLSLVSDIIKGALRELEAIGAGESPSPDEYADAVDCLNAMLLNWQADESFVNNLALQTFTLTAGTVEYTIGPTGDFVTLTRPLRILSAYITLDSTDYPMEILGIGDYYKINNKDAVTGPPCYLFYQPTGTVGTITLWPGPDTAYGLSIQVQPEFVPYANQDTALGVSTEWYDAMIYNLAVRLAPQFGVPLKPSTAAFAKRSLERVQYLKHVAQKITPTPSANLVV